MARKSGRAYSVGVGAETVRGTAVAPAMGLPVLEFDFEEKWEKVKNESNLGVIDKISGADIIKNWSEGSFTMKLQHKSLGYILKGIFGQSAAPVQDGSTGVYTHTFNRANNNQHASLTFAIKQPDEDLRFPLSMVDEAEFTADDEDWAQVEGSFMGGAPETATNTITYVDETEFVGRHCQVFIDDALADLDSATPEENIKSISANFSKNLEAIYTLGASTPADIINTALEVDGEIEVFDDGTVWKARVSDNVKKAMRFRWQNTDVTIGTGSPSVPNPRLDIDVAAAMFEEPEGDYDLDGPVMRTINWFGTFSIADAMMVRAKLINDRSTQY